VANILPQIKHIVMVMFENRSFDNMCGWIYSDQGKTPSLFLPECSPAEYDGLKASLWNPSNASFFDGQPPVQVPVANGTTSFTVPNPDPEETFINVNYQLFGPQDPNQDPHWPMKGFVVNYEDTNAPIADEIMQTYSPTQVPVITALAENYAISDAWFCSVPSQTWPNRAFVTAGTSNGNVNNGDPPDPLQWDVPTIFNVLESMGTSWRVYADTLVTPSLVRTMFPKLWDPLLDLHFRGFGEFQEDCANNSLPQYSFLEPSFLIEPNDEHPPHDVSAGEQFMHAIWEAVSKSPAWNSTLLIVLYDEHGGCYDHVLPPFGAAAPDSASNPGQDNFAFNRFGVRVPAVLVSPYIQAGTVFRSNTATPYDHTSVLATLRDWIGIPTNQMLPSKRIAAAPNLAQVLTLTTPRTDMPSITAPSAPLLHTLLTLPPNDLQRSIVAGAAKKFGMDAAAVLDQVKSRQHAIDFFQARAASANRGAGTA
jgi:phospholipase C